MLHIFYGSNFSASRKAFAEAISLIDKGNTDIIQLDSIEDVAQHIRTTQSLFAHKTAYVLENVLSLKKSRDEALVNSKLEHCDIYIWDNKADERTITAQMKSARLQKFAYSENVWKLLDGLTPGSRNRSISMLKNVLLQEEAPLLLFLMQRRIKELILAKKSLYIGAKKQDWQRANINRQAAQWESSKLLRFYQRLIDLEISTKSSTLMYPLEDSLEMVCAFHI